MTTSFEPIQTCPDCGAPLSNPYECDACPWRAPRRHSRAGIPGAPAAGDDELAIAADGERPERPEPPAWRACAGPKNVCGSAHEPRLLQAEDPCPTCDGSTVPVIGFLTREPHHPADSYDETDDTFAVGDRTVPADAAHDVCRPIIDAGDNRMIYPQCPDCGGAVAWAESGGVPGTRACIGEASSTWESRLWRERIKENATAGEPPPKLPGRPGCGSMFADSRYHAAWLSHHCDRHPETRA